MFGKKNANEIDGVHDRGWEDDAICRSRPHRLIITLVGVDEKAKEAKSCSSTATLPSPESYSPARDDDGAGTHKVFTPCAYFFFPLVDKPEGPCFRALVEVVVATPRPKFRLAKWRGNFFVWAFAVW